MKQKVFAILLALVLVLTMAVPASADFGGAGNMISPAVLELIPRDGVANRSWASPARFTWSYAPLFFKPDERETSSAEGPAPTDPETDTASEHLKLQGPTACRLYWNSGWSPDRVAVTSWNTEVFSHPESPEAYVLGTEDLQGEEMEITLEPGRVYQFHAVWELDYADDETGEADYYVVTEQMTEEEIAAAEARRSAPFSEADLQLLTLKINGVDCVVGTTTPQELKNRGLSVWQEMDGEFAVTAGEDPYGFIYVGTADGTMDSPIISINAFWGYGIPLEYCGVVWHDGEDDPYDDWDEDPDPDEDDTDEDDTDDTEPDESYDEDDFDDMFTAVAALTDYPFYVEESVEGIYSTVVTLSNGRELSVSHHDSPPSLYLPQEESVGSGER